MIIQTNTVLLTHLIHLFSQTLHLLSVLWSRLLKAARDVRMIIQLSTLISLHDTQTFRNSNKIFHPLLCFTPMSLSKHVYAFIWHFYERLSSSTSTNAHISSLNKLVSVFFLTVLYRPTRRWSFCCIPHLPTNLETLLCRWVIWHKLSLAPPGSHIFSVNYACTHTYITRVGLARGKGGRKSQEKEYIYTHRKGAKDRENHKNNNKNK